MENEVIKRADYLHRTQMCGNEEPEIGINAESGMITISKYRESYGAIWIEDVCASEEVDIDKLRKLAMQAHMYCTL